MLSKLINIKQVKFLEILRKYLSTKIQKSTATIFEKYISPIYSELK